MKSTASPRYFVKLWLLARSLCFIVSFSSVRIELTFPANRFRLLSRYSETARESDYSAIDVIFLVSAVSATPKPSKRVGLDGKGQAQYQ